MRLPEEGIQVGQQGISFPQGLSVAAGVVRAKQPGLPSFGFQVAMAPEEGVVGAQLVPPHYQLCFSIAKEPTNISTYSTNKAIRSKPNQNDSKVTAGGQLISLHDQLCFSDSNNLTESNTCSMNHV